MSLRCHIWCQLSIWRTPTKKNMTPTDWLMATPTLKSNTEDQKVCKKKNLSWLFERFLYSYKSNLNHGKSLNHVKCIIHVWQGKFKTAVLSNYYLISNGSHIIRKSVYAICKQQRLGSACAVWSAPLLFTALIVLYLWFLYPKFQVSS